MPATAASPPPISRFPALYPPGPTSPRLHQLWRFNQDFIGFMEDCGRRFGDTFTIRVKPYDAMVVATAPAEIEAILFDRDRFTGGDALADFLTPLVGARSVIVASGADHMRQRKLLLPPFHGERVRGWSARIETIAAAELNRLPLGRPVALRPVMQRIAFAVICRLVFGMDDEARIAELGTAVARLTDPRLAPLLSFPSLLQRGDRLGPGRLYFSRRDPVDRLILAEIARHREALDPEKRDDVLALLMAARDDDGRPLGDEELRDELLGLLIAGHETTATALAWAGERLARHPLSQALLKRELAAGGKEYLDAVVDETLRSRPPVIDAIRTATRNTELSGHPIFAGTPVAAMFCIANRRADLWPQPLAFRPERFLEDKPPPYSFTPFGGGLRRCIGSALATSEIRIVLEALLARFRLEAPPSAEERMRLVAGALVPSRGGRVVLRRPALGAPASAAGRAEGHPQQLDQAL